MLILDIRVLLCVGLRAPWELVFFLMKSGDVEARNSTKQFYKRSPKPRVTCRRVDRYLTHFGPGPTAALLYSSSAHVYNMLYHVLRMPDALPHDAAVDILWFKVEVRNCSPICLGGCIMASLPGAAAAQDECYALLALYQHGD